MYKTWAEESLKKQFDLTKEKLEFKSSFNEINGMSHYWIFTDLYWVFALVFVAFILGIIIDIIAFKMKKHFMKNEK